MTDTRIATQRTDPLSTVSAPSGPLVLPDSRPWSPTAGSDDDGWLMAKVLGVTNATIGDETWPVVHLATIDGDRLVLLGFVREATR